MANADKKPVKKQKEMPVLALPPQVQRHAPTEAPVECVKRLVELYKENKLTSFETAACVCMILAWAFGKLHGPDNRLVMSAADGDGDMLSALEEAVEEISGEVVESNVMTAIIPEVLLRILLARLLEAILDKLEEEEILKPLVDLVRGWLEGLL